MKNKVYEVQGSFFRVLEMTEDKVLVIDCIKRTMPVWKDRAFIKDCAEVTEERLIEVSGVSIFDTIEQKSEKTIIERYTLIAGVLPFVADEKARSWAIRKVAEQYDISKPTIRHYLCLYLAFMNKAVLAARERPERELTADEKTMRWALNKYYYSSDKNSLMTAYTYMLKEKYGSDGKLAEE